MISLALKLRPQKRETIMSFVSRLAAKNGPSFVQDFCLDMGLKWRKLVYSDAQEIDRLSTLVDICPKNLIQRALVQVDRRRCYLNGQLLGTQSFIRNEQKICPLCLHDDERTLGEFGVFGRREWLLSSFRVCPMHKCRLIVLPRVQFPRHPSDFYRRYESNRGRIARHLSEASVRLPANWERYLIGRLGGVTGQNWLDQFDLDAAMQIVQNLGIVLQFGPNAREAQLSPWELSNACNAGFVVASGSAERIITALTSVKEQSSSTKPGLYIDFGTFARWCTRVFMDMRYSAMIDIVTSFAFDNYPISKGELLFGRQCPERKWHNCSSAARAYGSSISRMRRLMDGLELGEKKDGKPRLFRVDDGDVVLPGILRCIPRIECIRRLGVHHDMFDQIVANHFVKPTYAIPQVAPLFDPDDIDSLLSEIRANSRSVTQPSEGRLDLRATCNAATCSFAELLPKLLAGDLAKTEWVMSKTGLQALRFDLEDVRDVLEGEPTPGFTKEQLKSILCINGPTVKMLIDSKKLKATEVRHHRSRRPMQIVEAAEVQRFLSKFVSLGEMAKNEDIQANWVAARLAKRDIYPIKMAPKFSKLYLRGIVEF